MMTAEEYIDSLRKLGPRKVYLRGDVLDPDAITDHPMIRPSINACAMTYRLAELPEYRDLFTTTSNLTGKPVNCFTSVFMTRDDLIRKVRRLRACGAMTGVCFQRCAGGDALNALYNVTFEIDAKHKTDYHERFKKFVTKWQENDWTVGAAMTDPKGNRGLPPESQPDPDIFLHVVEEREDGVVINGAKMHLTGILNSHWILIMPTLSLKAGQEKYAISFAIPSDHPNITYIYGRQPSDTRKLEGTLTDAGNIKFGGQEVMTIFENIFVPWEDVFMNGETEFAGMLVERFAGTHRQSYGGCKPGNGDVLIGACQCMAEFNGVEKASHIRDKIVEMIHLNETMYGGGIACGTEGHKTAAGAYEIDMMLGNVCKQNVTRIPFEIARLAQDIAGGLMVTLPADTEFNSPEVGHYCRKYLQGNNCTAEERQRILRLIETMTLGAIASGYLTESMHGAGSPQAQRIMIARQSNMEAKKRLAKRLCGLEPDTIL